MTKTNSALANAAKLLIDTAVVMRAVTMSAALLAVFAAAAVMLLVDMALEKRGKRHEKAA